MGGGLPQQPASAVSCPGLAGEVRRRIRAGIWRIMHESGHLLMFLATEQVHEAL